MLWMVFFTLFLKILTPAYIQRVPGFQIQGISPTRRGPGNLLTNPTLRLVFINLQRQEIQFQAESSETHQTYSRR